MYKETTAPMLRPHQVENMKEEARRLEASLQAPPHVQSAIQSPGEMRKQLQSIAHSLDKQAPKPYREEEKDIAAQREKELRNEILKGMPTGREQRRNPAGNVDKHRTWEQRNKNNILEWKNIRLRMHASDMLDELPDAKDVANFERYRPTESSSELNMHNEQIPGKIQHGPFSTEPSTVFTDEDKALLNEIDPEIADGLALMNNEQRAKVKAFIQDVVRPHVAQEVKKRREMTPEQKERARENLAKARAARKAKEG